MRSVQVRSALYVLGSKNAKIGKADATYASIEASCPSSCPLKGNGCYADNFIIKNIVSRLDTQASKRGSVINSIAVARDEAKAIARAYAKNVPPGTILRLHVSGDVRTKKAARILDAAVAEWKAKGGECAWSYTHAWRAFRRSDVANISMLASIDSPIDAKKALKKGFAPALVVSHFESDKAFEVGGVSFIPCPAQTHDLTCEKCRLCLNADKLHAAQKGIAFAAHGVRANTIKKRLQVIQ